MLVNEALAILLEQHAMIPEGSADVFPLVGSITVVEIDHFQPNPVEVNWRVHSSVSLAHSKTTIHFEALAC